MKNEIFDAFSKLDILDKRKEIADELAELMFIIQKLRIDINQDVDQNINQDIKELFLFNSSEDTYMTSIYKNIFNLKEELAIYLDKVTDLYYEKDENITE